MYGFGVRMPLICGRTCQSLIWHQIRTPRRIFHNNTCLLLSLNYFSSTQKRKSQYYKVSALWRHDTHTLYVMDLMKMSTLGLRNQTFFSITKSWIWIWKSNIAFYKKKKKGFGSPPTLMIAGQDNKRRNLNYSLSW